MAIVEQRDDHNHVLSQCHYHHPRNTGAAVSLFESSRRKHHAWRGTDGAQLHCHQSVHHVVDCHTPLRPGGDRGAGRQWSVERDFVAAELVGVVGILQYHHPHHIHPILGKLLWVHIPSKISTMYHQHQMAVVSPYSFALAFTVK